MRHLLSRHDVGWVNTIGTRRPRIDLATLARALEKIGHWAFKKKTATAEPARLRQCNPRMLPGFSPRLFRALNKKVLSRQLARFVRTLPGPVVAVTTLPIVADLVGLLPVSRWVYYCVDDFSLWPGLDQRVLGDMEKDLVSKVDALIAVSETLQDKLGRLGRQAHLLTHGVEPAFWEASGPPVPLPQLTGIEQPLVLFWGVIDRRMDLEFIKRLGADLEQGTIVLVGPQDHPYPEVLQCKRVVVLPRCAFEELPHLARAASVLVMPYADLPVTRAMQPLKLKEYLATGKATVVRNLPATRPWADCLDLARTSEEFSKAVRLRLQTGVPQGQQESRARLADESWSEKARAFERWICGSAETAYLPCHA